MNLANDNLGTKLKLEDRFLEVAMRDVCSLNRLFKLYSIKMVFHGQTSSGIFQL